MTNIFVFTAGNADARRHLEASIRQPIEDGILFKTFEPPLHDRLKSIREKANGFFAWGAEPGARNLPNWEAMGPGDLILCVYDNTYHYFAEVLDKFDNPTFAQAVWGTNPESGNTWRYMYFLSHPTEVEVPVSEAADVLPAGYRGFTRISEEKVRHIIARHGDVQRFADDRLFRRNRLDADDFLPILRRYLEDGTVFQSPIRGHRYRVLELDATGALIDRIDANDPERVTLERYLALIQRVRAAGGSAPLEEAGSTRIVLSTLAQGASLAISPDRKLFMDVSRSSRALDVLIESVRHLHVAKQDGVSLPYKALTVATVVSGIEEGELSENKITFEWMAPRFARAVADAGIEAGEQQAAYAFFHLASELFWLLSYRDPTHPIDDPTAKRLRRETRHASLKDAFWRVLQTKEAREKLMAELRPWMPLPRSARAPANAEELEFQRAVDDFSDALQECGLRLGASHLDRVRAFVVSLATKRFAILTGLSGSGKTQLALRFGEWLGRGALRVVPVRPDWTGPEPLFGYEDALQQAHPQRGRPWHVPTALAFILEAAANPDRPYLLLLDEMNLAHVERYFTDFLSGMESAQPCLPNLERVDGRWMRRTEAPAEIPVPSNLFVGGTVNVDETTYMFSPKVLDRANTFEFRVATEDLITTERRPSVCRSGDQGLVSAYLSISRDEAWHAKHPPAHGTEFLEKLREVHALLAEGRFEFGHRTYYEASRFAALLHAAGDPGWERALDLQILQKVLPRLHGTRRRLEPTLNALARFCYALEFEPGSTFTQHSPSFDPAAAQASLARLPLAFEKVQRMVRSVQANQFVSYAE